MGWGAQSWLKMTSESTYGTYNAGGTVTWFRLPGNNAFTPRSTPQRQIIKSADSGNRRRQQVANRKVITGNLQTLFYPTQAAAVLGAALTLTSNDLASYTLDFWDSVQVHRFLGCKVSALTINGSAQQDYCTLQLAWQAQQRATTTLAAPTDANLPSDLPYQHYESKGLFKLAGSALTKYSDLSFTVNNNLKGTWDEDQWITNLYYCGRDCNLSYNPQYVSSTMRTAFEAQTALTFIAAWARPSGLTTTLTLQTAGYAANLGDDLPLDGPSYQRTDIEVFYDTTNSTDITFTVA